MNPAAWKCCLRAIGLGLIAPLLPPAQPAVAQHHRTSLSEAEEEQVRDAALEPARRVAVYQAIIEARIRRIQDVLANTRAQGRRDDFRDTMESIAGLVDELQDNLEEYDSAHRDLRKPLPKLLDAIPRWESVLRQPSDNPAYDLTRTLALEAVADVRKEAAEMLPQQTAYFKAHPPTRDGDANKVGPVLGAEKPNPR